MPWFYLVIAGLFECGWAIGLKYTEGFTRLVPSLLTVAAMVLSFWFVVSGHENNPGWYSIRCMDRHRCGRGGDFGYGSIW